MGIFLPTIYFIKTDKSVAEVISELGDMYKSFLSDYSNGKYDREYCLDHGSFYKSDDFIGKAFDFTYLCEVDMDCSDCMKNGNTRAAEEFNPYHDELIKARIALNNWSEENGLGAACRILGANVTRRKHINKNVKTARNLSLMFDRVANRIYSDYDSKASSRDIGVVMNIIQKLGVSLTDVCEKIVPEATFTKPSSAGPYYSLVNVKPRFNSFATMLNIGMSNGFNIKKGTIILRTYTGTQIPMEFERLVIQRFPGSSFIYDRS